MLSGEIQIRVRYAETDRGGLLHHANYLVYLEQARTELLRSLGASYKDLEDQGFFLVVSRAELKFKAPIFYDDVVTIKTTVTRTTPVRIEHAYAVHRPDGQVACEATTTLACIGKDGKLQPLPGWLSGAK